MPMSLTWWPCYLPHEPGAGCMHTAKERRISHDLPEEEKDVPLLSGEVLRLSPRLPSPYGPVAVDEATMADLPPRVRDVVNEMRRLTPDELRELFAFILPGPGGGR